MGETEIFLLNNKGKILRTAPSGFGAVRISVVSTNEVAVITDNKYKFIIKDTEGYNCSNANGFSYSSTDLDEVLAKAEVYKKGETIYATFNDDSDVLLVYSDSDEKKYERPYSSFANKSEE